ncbi:MAG: HEAT repeat domain-containing protein [Deltaproteobacteria bacterium]|nr:HEAT repeat domain-containing protein [Deltaproteobacteria bacterium]
MHPDHPYDASPHGLLQGARSPGIILIRLLRVHPGEVRVLLWVTAIQIVMSISNVLVNNLSQATFLKRFGVEYLPVVFLIEAVVTFFVANGVGLLMTRFRTLRVFSGLLALFAAAGVGFRLLIPLGQELLYPALFVFKSMAIGVLPILYWDIVSDLFTTQQGKRLYTLITAGGILGTTAGSLMTGRVARWVGVDNILWIFAAGMILAAVLNETTERVIGRPVEPRVDRKPGERKPGLRREVREFLDYARQSTLLKAMVLIVAIPNMVLPVLTYQFNVGVDAYFATEQGAVDFFGLFRGVSNAVVFGALMVSGRLVTRWGVPTTLLIHPVNYLVSFAALFLRLDIFTAVYARFSTELFKSTLNNPSRAILYNFFPKRIRGMIRVFLRGNVVRAADFAGSGLLILAVGLVEPSRLSLVAAPLVMIWVITNLWIKGIYPKVLVQSLAERQIDWKGMEEMDFRAWFQDPPTRNRLFAGLESEDPDVAVTCGEILARARPAGWTEALLKTVDGKPPRVQGLLLNLLPKEDFYRVREVLGRLKENSSPETLAHILRTLARMNPSACLSDLLAWSFHPDPGVAEEALAGLYASGDSRGYDLFFRRVSSLLEGGERENRFALRLLARTGDPAFEEVLLEAAGEPDPEERSLALAGLGRMQHAGGPDLARRAMEDPDPRVRRAGLEILRGRSDEASMKALVSLLDDPDPVLCRQAEEALRERGPAAVPALLAAAAAPSRDLQEQALTLLKEQGLPRAEVTRFALQTLESAYLLAACDKVLERVDPSPAVGFLQTHLRERARHLAEVVLRMLGATDFQDRKEVILRAVRSRDRRDVEDALEALETSIHPSLGRLLVPLLAKISTKEQLALAKGRVPGLEALSSAPIEQVLERLMDSPDPATRELARTLSAEMHPEDRRIPSDDDLTSRLELLRLVPLFHGLSMDDLVALSGVLEPLALSPGMLVIRENDPGDALYLVQDGELSVIKSLGRERELKLASVGRGGFIGELALIDRAPRSASVRVETETRLLTLRGDRFMHLMKRRANLPLNVCRVLVRRIKDLESRLFPRTAA